MLDVAIERQERKKNLPGLRVGWAMAHPAAPALLTLTRNNGI